MCLFLCQYLSCSHFFPSRHSLPIFPVYDRVLGHTLADGSVVSTMKVFFIDFNKECCRRSCSLNDAPGILSCAKPQQITWACVFFFVFLVCFCVCVCQQGRKGLQWHFRVKLSSFLCTSWPNMNADSNESFWRKPVFAPHSLIVTPWFGTGFVTLSTRKSKVVLSRHTLFTLIFKANNFFMHMYFQGKDSSTFYFLISFIFNSSPFINFIYLFNYVFLWYFQISCISLSRSFHLLNNC